VPVIPGLSDLEERLAWAKLKARDTGEAGRRVLGQDYSVLVQVEADGYEHAYRLFALPTIPVRLALRLGDVLHNCRAALDGIVYELARQEHARIDERQLVFPIAEREDQFESSRHRLAGLSADLVEWLRSVQPYANEAHRQPLLACEALNNIDKHRRVTVLLEAVTSHQMIIPGKVVKSDHREMGVVSEGFEFARLTFHKPRSERYADIRPGLELGVERRWGLDWLLDNVPACVEALLKQAPLER
jgi:hypothetical protein